MEIFSVRDLSFRYPDSDELILDNMNFRVYPGEFITLCGLSGCGKTTLLRHLKTALTPWGERTGEILFRGITLDDVPEKEQASEIGFVMQSPDNQSVCETVREEIAFGPESLGIRSTVINRNIAETAAFFGLESILCSRTDTLSGGQKQLVNLASVMILHPDILILDEPTAQLDPVSSQTIINALKKINSELGTTVIICEHTLEETFSVSDRIIVMEKGRIISDSDPESCAALLRKENHVMFDSMPSSVRISMTVQKELEDIPVNVPEGRKWLSDYTGGKRINYIPDKENRAGEHPCALELKNIWFRYEKNSRDILKGIDLKLGYGEIFSVVGGNGSGKTTLLCAITGFNKVYRGSIIKDGKKINKGKQSGFAYLPQDPGALFIGDTLSDDLNEVLSGRKLSDASKKKMISEVISLCGLEGLTGRHPYDLSCGEKQKAAIAKLLLTRPDILLLDEPVKGLDVRSKREIGNILRTLASMGKCIILVSHDMEFCAEYSHRCALFHDGQLIGGDPPADFFCENSFYTTCPRRISAGIIENAVTVDDVLLALNIQRKNKRGNSDKVRLLFEEIPCEAGEKTAVHRDIRHIISVIASVAFIISLMLFTGILSPLLPGKYSAPAAAAVLLTGSAAIASGLIFKKKRNKIDIRSFSRSSKAMVLSVILISVAVPFTIFTGIFFFRDSKYLFISLLICLECMIPFFAVFEKRSIRAREIVIISVMCAFAVVSRSAFYMLPQFKPMTAIVIISGAALGAESGFLVGSVSIFASNIVFGQGPWTPWQMFAMGLIGFLSGIIFGSDRTGFSRVTLSVYGFFVSVIIYGGIMDPAAMIMSHIEPTIENLRIYYLTGLPLDTVHGISTFIFLFLGSEAFIKKLERVKLKYGLIDHSY